MKPGLMGSVCGSERISAHPEAGAPLGGEFRKRIVPGFPYNVIYRI